MSHKAMEEWKAGAEAERLRLAAGEKPAPKLKHKLQRTAARALAGFFALMVVLTLVSRAADGVTVARVQAEGSKTGVLTQRQELAGAIQPLGDLSLSLPGGILISDILAKQGDRVAAGDVLLELDQGDLERQMTKLAEDLRILELRLAAAESGATSTDTDAILAAEQALADAQEDYRRLLEKQELAGQRGQEDLAEAEAQREEAQAKLEQAREKAKKELVKAAEDKVAAAQKSLDAAKESAELAIDSARKSLTAAQDSQKSYNKSYYDSVKNLNNMEDELRTLQKKLAELEAAGAGEEELQAARDQVAAAQAAVDSASWSMQNYSYGGDLAVKRAEEELKKVQARQEEKVLQSEAELAKEQAALEEVKACADVSEEALVVAAQAALDAAQQAVKTAQRGVEDGQVSQEDQRYAAQRAVETAQRNLETARRKAEEAARTAQQSDAKARQQAEIERLGYLSQKRELEQSLAELRRVRSAGGKLTAPVAGTVRSILENTGKTQAGQQLATLSRDDQGFTFTAQVEQKQAEKLALGDEGELSYTREGKTGTLQVAVTGIGVADDKGMVTVTALLPQGDWSGGGSGTLTLSKRSQQYNTTLPLGALRSDGDGDYVLVVREKRTVMGAEQTVARIGVTVLEKDSQRMAIQDGSGLVWDDQVVISAGKPIEEGDRVRLEGLETETR